MDTLWICLATAILSSLWSMTFFVSTAHAQPDLPIESIRCPDGVDRDGKVKYRTADYEGRKDLYVCQIGDRVEVNFKPGTLKSWQDEGSTNNIADLVLGIDGQAIPGSNAQRLEPEGSEPDRLAFRLVREAGDADNLSAWKQILPKTKLWDSQTKLVSVVDPNGAVLGSKRIGIRVAPPGYIIAMGVLAVVVVAGLLVLAWRSDLLKDIAAVPNDSRRPYSLAMTQMAFWIALVFAGFIYLTLVLGSIDVFSASALGLIGISATTGVFATAIGGAKRSEQASKRQQLLDEKQRLERENAGLLASSSTPNATPEEFRLTNAKFAANKELLDQIEIDLKSTTSDSSIASAGGKFRFFWDLILSDGSVSLPRFQMIAWTLAFGFYYVYSVIMTLQMPEFSATVLGMLGLSSGTYVGFKFPSKDGK